MSVVDFARRVKKASYSRVIDKCCFVTTISFKHDLVIRHPIHYPEHFTYKIITDPADSLIATIAGLWDISADTIRQRLFDGHLCYLGFIDDVPAHMAWVQDKNNTLHYIKPAGLLYNIPDKAFMIYHADTLERFRRIGIYSAILWTILDNEKQAGYTLGLISAEASNKKSCAGILKCSFIPFKKYLAFWFLSKEYFIKEYDIS